jgi:diacylglycerol kinase family enzyme
LSTIDIATVNGRKFANVSGFGLSSRVNQEISKRTKRHMGMWAYPLYAIKIFRGMKPFSVHLKHDDGQEHSFRALQVTVCNGKHFGPGLLIDENAKIDDGKLDVIIFKIDSAWNLFKVIPMLLSGKFTEHKGQIFKFETAEVVIETRHPLRIDLDGELGPSTPATYKLIPHSLKVYRPNSSV